MAISDTTATPPRRHRSRITRGTKLLPSAHSQSVWARIMRDMLDAVVAHCGGEENITELQRTQARRIAALEAELIHIENRIATAHTDGRDPATADLDLYSRLSNGQRRHCEALGWERKARDITEDINSYVRRVQAERAAAVVIDAEEAE